jgi:hypothetical protein
VASQGGMVCNRCAWIRESSFTGVRAEEINLHSVGPGLHIYHSN